MRFLPLIPLAFSIVVAPLASAEEVVKVKDLHISQTFARATAPNQPAGAAYVTIENKGKTADKLVGASSSVAQSVEIHTMSMEGNVMKMREVPGVELKPAAKVEMKPGDGYHLMLMGLNKPLKAGERITVTLNFEKSGKAEVSMAVQDKKDSKPAAAHQQGHHGH